MKATWSEAAVHALGVRTDVETAGSIFGLSRTQAYEAVKAGRFPVPVLRVGRRMVVPTAPIRRLLEMETAAPAPPGPAARTSSPYPLLNEEDTSERNPTSRLSA